MPSGNVQKLWVELEMWLSEVSQWKLTFYPSVCIFQDMAYKGAEIPYPMRWTILFSSIILKYIYLKTENQPMSALKCFIIQMLKVHVGNREK
jgi:hypothetical protein